MYVFTLLGIVLDMFKDGYIISAKDGVGFTDVNTINKYILPLCYEFCGAGEWKAARINFSRNPHCRKGEIESIVVSDSTGECVVCPVGKSILEEVSEELLDGVYFDICDEILSR